VIPTIPAFMPKTSFGPRDCSERSIASQASVITKEQLFEKEEAKMKRKKLARLQNMAASLKLQLVPLP
jgi:hypothetical protein